MKVKEMIEALSDCSPDSDVTIKQDGDVLHYPVFDVLVYSSDQVPIVTATIVWRQNVSEGGAV